jgi:hypothetical protein
MDSHDHGARESEDVRHHTTHEHAHIEAGREESNPEVFDLEKVAGQQPLKRKSEEEKTEQALERYAHRFNSRGGASRKR